MKQRLEHEVDTSGRELGLARERVRALEGKVSGLREEVSSHTSPDALIQSKEEQINDLEEKLSEQSDKAQVGYLTNSLSFCAP